MGLGALIGHPPTLSRFRQEIRNLLLRTTGRAAGQAKRTFCLPHSQWFGVAYVTFQFDKTNNKIIIKKRK